MVALGLYYEKSSSPGLNQEERKEIRIVGENPPEPETPRTEAANSSSGIASPTQQGTNEAEKRLADTEAYIEARLLQLRAIGVREAELEQFTKPRLDTFAIQQALTVEEDRAKRITAFVTAAKKQKEDLSARIEAMLRKSQSESQLKRFTPRPDASLQELEELSAKLEESTVKAMRE